MKQELEIEYKNLLTKKEYQYILEKEFLSLAEKDQYQQITQTNHYFDTKEKTLQQQGAALRIRILDSKNELTFKVPADDFLMETNISLTDSQVKNILRQKSFTLNTLTNEELKLNLKNINHRSTFIHFNSFKTVRYEKKSASNLLVLDQTTFQNDQTDYELEVEGANSKKAKEYFDSILTKYAIPLRKSFPKIARAEDNK